ncbi:hypothetical protein IKX73_00965 [Candidatus Saccharibacteria bacterium]|nr:hypothetical protein [Candidatus Saccharibacteria bacterium]
MIDTVILRVNYPNFRISPSVYRKFSPSAHGIFGPPYYSFGSGKVIKCVLQLKAKDKKLGVYQPRVTLMKAIRAGGVSVFLHIEFSAPKILYNNNFDELSSNDFKAVCAELYRKLYKLGIEIKRNQIERAEVKTVHFGKNIIFDDYRTAASVIGDIAKANVSTRKQADMRVYRNDGEALHFYSASQAIAIYDKRRELAKSRVSERGLLEKDNYCQLTLFDNIRSKKPFEVVRVEARYNTKRAFNTALKHALEYGRASDSVARLATKQKLVFVDIFNEELAKTLLEYEFAQIEAKNLDLNETITNTATSFLHEINTLNPKATLAQRLETLAIWSLMRETGSRDVRKMTGANSAQWSRLTKKISKIYFRTRKSSSTSYIEDKLAEFKPVRLLEYFTELNKVRAGPD